MVAAAITWIVVSPYLVGLLVGNFRPLNRVVARNVGIATSLGWSAMTVLLGAVLIAGGGTGLEVALFVAPFAGLAFWIPSMDDEGGDGPADPGAAPDDPPPLRRVLRQPPRLRRVPPAPPRVRGGRGPSRTAPRRS
jgi:hypothetical protein